LLAGMSVAALVVPQGMSYAKLAGLPPVWGLYGAFVPVMVYACLGSSRHLAVGPVAVTSLLLGSGLPSTLPPGVLPQADPNKPDDPAAQAIYNQAAIQVALLAGLMYTAVGLLRLGWVTNFLSHSVIGGFMSGASVIIGLNQVKFLFGYDRLPSPLPGGKPISFPRADNLQDNLANLFSKDWLAQFKWIDLAMGLAWLAILIFMKEAGKLSRRLVWLRAFGPLSVTILSTALTAGLRLDQMPHKVKTVGIVPKGLPHQTVTLWFPMENAGKKAGLAVLVCLIDVLESISIAKSLAIKNRYELNATQELRGLGIANLVGAAFNCYTTTGSFSRSAIMDTVGARTQLAGLTGGIIVMLTLLVLTPLFRLMPNNAQGAIIISAVIGLIQVKEWYFLWRINKFDWLVFNAAMLGTMFLGVEMGLALAAGVSVALALYKSAFPHTAVLGRLPSTAVYRNVKQYEDATTVPGLLLVRIDAPLFFANVAPVADALRKYEARANAEGAAGAGEAVRWVIVDLSPVTDLDATAVHWLREWARDLSSREVGLALANPSRVVADLMTKAGLVDSIGKENIYVRMHDAVAGCLAKGVALPGAEGGGGGEGMDGGNAGGGSPGNGAAGAEPALTAKPSPPPVSSVFHGV
jgi:sulfate transporter 4